MFPSAHLLLELGGSSGVSVSVAQVAATVTATGGTQVAAVALTAMQTSQDDFDFGGIDSGKWSTWGSTTTTATTNLCLEMTSTLAANYGGTLSLAQFNLTGSYAFAQLVDAGNQAITSLEVYPIELSSGTNALSVMVNLGTVYARKKVSGSYSTVGSGVAYNSTTMKWFRVRESAGTTYWDYATDPAGSWTNIASLANPITVTALTGGSTIGTWQAEGSTSTIKVDNFNVIPASLQFTWKGYTWNKRIHQGSPANKQLWGASNTSGPDVSDYLTLSITNPTGSAPISGEFFSAKRGFGYGTYTAVIGTRLDNIDQRNAFGNLFLFDFTAPPAYREIDSAEVRNYNSNPNMRILHSHVYNNAGVPTFITDDMDITADVVQTHRLIWEPGKITFDAFVGTGTGGTNYFHTVHTTNVPTPSLERVHFNIWNNINVTGYLQAPALDVVVRDFSFTPPSAAVAQIAASVTATGGTQVATAAAIVNVSVAQLAAAVTATGGTQVAKTNATLAQVGAVVTATGGTQTPAAVRNTTVAQVSAAVTATGGTQVLATVNNVSVAQVGALVTAIGGTQVLATVNKVSVAQVGASVTATGGTQLAVTNASVTQVGATITAIGGTQVGTAGGAGLVNASVTQLAATVTATGGTQVLATVNNVTVAQVAATVTASGGTQTIATIRNAGVAQVAATITASGGTQSTSTVNNASVAQVAASVTAFGGTQLLAAQIAAIVNQVGATITATGGTQSAATNASVAQLAATVTATGGNQAVSASTGLQNATVAQVGATVTATGGLQVVSISTSPLPPLRTIYIDSDANVYLVVSQSAGLLEPV